VVRADKQFRKRMVLIEGPVQAPRRPAFPEGMHETCSDVILALDTGVTYLFLVIFFLVSILDGLLASALRP
jgi:hypothetical protein